MTTAKNPETVIKLTEITKTFPGIIANDSISLTINAGEVHCLLGENGAGKSTLINILAGLQKPDSGIISINDKPVELTSPSVSIAHGIGVVYQHSALIPTLSVLENLMLGDKKSFLLNKDKATIKLQKLNESLGTQIEPEMFVEDLSLGQRQQVEIAKAMREGSRVLILDEPTSMLTPQAVTNLMKSLHRLKKQGMAIVFITHKLREAYEVGDRVTVLKSGQVVDELSPQRLNAMTEKETRERILKKMFGETPKTLHPLKRDLSKQKNIIELKNLCTVARSATQIPIKNLTLNLRKGEILGVAGIDGQGQKHLAETIAGQIYPATGKVILAGKDITNLSVKQRQQLGVRYVTDDRINEGIVGRFSVALNLFLKKIGEKPFWRFGRLNRQAMLTEAKKQIVEYDIRTPTAETRAGTLSGGNIQKILLARELSYDPKVVVFHKPTYGLDLKTVYRVRESIRNFANNGGAVFLISTDLDELVETADRIVVISRGEIVGEVSTDSDRVAEKIGKMMVDSQNVRVGYVKDDA